MLFIGKLFFNRIPYEKGGRQDLPLKYGQDVYPAGKNGCAGDLFLLKALDQADYGGRNHSSQMCVTVGWAVPTIPCKNLKSTTLRCDGRIDDRMGKVQRAHQVQ